MNNHGGIVEWIIALLSLIILTAIFREQIVEFFVMLLR